MALNTAKQVINDEFYTRKEDIAKELCNYKKFLNDKVIFCNCDDPEWSNFWIYLHENFKEFNLKRLIATHYNANGSPSYKMEYCGGNDSDPKDWHQKSLIENGDFNSSECENILKEYNEDIVVITNPPFSIARERFIPLLYKYNVKYIIIGDLNWVVYKDVFPLIQTNQMFFGYTTVKEFYTPSGDIQKFGNKLWYTNFNIPKREKCLLDELDKSYERHPELYLHYYNYDAINVDKVDDIPEDYYGIMGVPITFLSKHNPNEFKVLSHHEPAIELEYYKTSPKFKEKKSRQTRINGVLCQKTYHRLFIQRVQEEQL